MFPYENNNKKIQNFGQPSEATWDDLNNVTWESIPGKWEDYVGSSKYNDILEIVGKEKQYSVDIKHLDSAYKSGCACFITNDKDDIYSKKVQLEPLLKIKILYSNSDEDQKKLKSLVS